MKTALIIVDIQNDYFPGGKFELEGAEDAAENAKKVLESFRGKGMPIIHVRHENMSEKPLFFAPGSTGAEINTTVSPQDDEKIIVKHFPNSFRQTELERELKDQQIEQVVIMGMMTLMCIDATARAAKDLGFEVTVINDACAARALEFSGVKVPAAQVHASFLAALQMSYATIQNTSSFLSSF